MDAVKNSKQSRRGFLTASAAMGVSSLLPAQAAEDNNAIRPFHVNIPEEQLVDLRRRIATTRWPDRETVTDQSQSVVPGANITITNTRTNEVRKLSSGQTGAYSAADLDPENDAGVAPVEQPEHRRHDIAAKDT